MRFTAGRQGQWAPILHHLVGDQLRLPTCSPRDFHTLPLLSNFLGRDSVIVFCYRCNQSAEACGLRHRWLPPSSVAQRPTPASWARIRVGRAGSSPWDSSVSRPVPRTLLRNAGAGFYRTCLSRGFLMLHMSSRDRGLLLRTPRGDKSLSGRLTRPQACLPHLLPMANGSLKTLMKNYRDKPFLSVIVCVVLRCPCMHTHTPVLLRRARSTQPPYEVG